MFKKILILALVTSAALSFAAVDLNRASLADLDSIKGVGPATSARIMEARKQGPFKSWEDFIARVKGIGEGNASMFSRNGVTIDGRSFQAPAASPSSKNDPAPKK